MSAQRTYSHGELKQILPPEEDGNHGFESGYEGQLYVRRRIPLAYIIDLDRQPYPPEAVVEWARGLRPSTELDAGSIRQLELIAKVRARKPLPPIVVRYWAGAFMLLDGSHRTVAYTALGRKTIEAFVRLEEKPTT
ncbi:MAG: ParB/RepB/Spo0J family partition protein [Mycetocola sp.]